MNWRDGVAAVGGVAPNSPKCAAVTLFVRMRRVACRVAADLSAGSAATRRRTTQPFQSFVCLDCFANGNILQFAARSRPTFR